MLVLLQADAEHVMLLDPPGPAYSVPVKQFARVWSGNILAFTSNEQLARQFEKGEVVDAARINGAGIGRGNRAFWPSSASCCGPKRVDPRCGGSLRAQPCWL